MFDIIKNLFKLNKEGDIEKIEEIEIENNKVSFDISKFMEDLKENLTYSFALISEDMTANSPYINFDNFINNYYKSSNLDGAMTSDLRKLFQNQENYKIAPIFKGIKCVVLKRGDNIRIFTIDGELKSNSLIQLDSIINTLRQYDKDFTMEATLNHRYAPNLYIDDLLTLDSKDLTNEPIPTRS